MKFITLFLLIVLVSFQARAQEQSDSIRIASQLESALDMARNGQTLDSALTIANGTKNLLDQVSYKYPELPIFRLYVKGRIYEKLENYQEGLKCLDSAIFFYHIEKRKTDKYIYARCLTHYAAASLFLNYYPNHAFDSLQKSVAVFKNLNNENNVLFASCYIAYYYDLINQFEKAENFYLELEKKIDSSYGSAYIIFFYDEFSKFYWRHVIVDKAIFYLHKINTANLNEVQICTNWSNELLYLSTGTEDTTGLSELLFKCIECNEKFVRDQPLVYVNRLNVLAEAIISKKVAEISLADSLLEVAGNLLNVDSIDLEKAINLDKFKNLVTYFYLKTQIALKNSDSIRIGNIAHAIRKLTRDFTLFDSIRPDQVGLMLKCGIQYYAQAKDPKVLDLLSKYKEFTKNQLNHALNFMTESELNQFFQNPLFSQVDIFFEKYDPAIMPESYVGNLYELALYSKGLLFRSSYRVNKLMNESKDSSILDIKRKLEDLEVKINKPEQTKNEILYKEKDALYKRILKYYRDSSNETFQCKYIQQSLDSNEIAVEFVKYKSTIGNSATEKYVAVVMDGEQAFPQVVPLCDEIQLSKVRSKIATNTESIPNLQNTATRGYGLRPKKSNQLKEYQLIWEPILKRFPNVKTIYFSPVGQLNKRNLSSISISDSLYMFDRYKIVQLTSTYNIPKLKQSRKIEAKTALLVGGVEYGKLPLEQNDSDKLYWNYLEGTLDEVNLINQQLIEKNVQTTLLTGKNANETTVRQQLKEPQSIIHVATHGYYDDTNEENKRTDYLRKNPLVNSVLVLSNANVKRQEVDLSNNGYLNALEISKMDLSHAQLVVLSACETALGESFSQYELNFSLIRGFKIAGANSIISTLWSINDKSAKSFMNYFYKHLILDGLSINEAFSATQKQMSSLNTNDTDWKAFVLTD